MDTAIVKTDANGAYNRYGEVVIPCKYNCGRMTTMTGTKACDFCWNNGGADRDARNMLVARLENMQKNGDIWITVQAVLALLYDCDRPFALREAVNAQRRP